MHLIIQKFIDGQLPEAMAKALVSGNLPVPPGDLLVGLAHAVFQETPFKEAAVGTLTAMPESLLSSALLLPQDPPDPLGLILTYRKEPALLETALLHPDMTSAWMERVVPFLPGSVLEIPLNNQVLWLERPAILDLLEEHPEAEYVIKRRVNEFRRDVLRLATPEIAAERLEIIDEVEAGRLDRAWSELPMPSAAPEEPQAAEEAEVDAARPEAEGYVDDEGNPIPLSLTKRIMRLRTNQKIMLAIKGGKEERTFLIREANRLIQVNVVRNPRITEGEVAFIAQMRTVNEEVIRVIAANREWLKKYPIVKALVLNPKTPIAISLNLFKRLVDLDLKLLMRDKGVTEVLRREAKRYLESKMHR
ncbi:hypothetical protein [Mesoterricola sediminis]|uniref:Uncharacterized protein n=1 Tax=Mesoterricola sediminis TaxID=2927980 RepID=A0AA48GZR4_9BACT|nr:hypothetical protein [Mesoterricola sediminis]BDU77385.1 hypothetical protein METESE_23430 [Mesoterricola sediminis]